MKKLGNALLLGALAAVLLTAVGCKSEEELGADAGKWGGQGVDKAGVENTLTLTADTGAIDFYCFTDDDGVVVEGYTSSGSVASEGGRITFDFAPIMNGKTTQTYTLYIHQPNVKPKKSNDANDVPGSRDFRGKVTIQSGGAVKIDASDYADEVSHIGILPIFCNEVGADDVLPMSPAGMKQNNNHGDYTITRVLPLEPVNKKLTDYTVEGTKYQTIQDLDFNITIPEKETKKLIMPAQDYPYAITLSQNQYVDGVEPDDTNKEKNADILWVKIQKVAAHIENAVMTSYSATDAKINKDTFTVQKSAYDAPAVFVLEPVVPGEK